MTEEQVFKEKIKVYIKNISAAKDIDYLEKKDLNNSNLHIGRENVYKDSNDTQLDNNINGVSQWFKSISDKREWISEEDFNCTLIYTHVHILASANTKFNNLIKKYD